MTFHRLNTATYYGAPLAGYDRLNDPTTTGGSGIATPADTADKSGGTYDGVYFIAEGEAANAFNLNRPVRALGESVDLLDDTLHRSIAQKTTSSFASVGDATRDLNGSVDNIYTGAAAGLADLYFQVTDSDGKPIYVSGRRVTVATSSVAIGSGFSSANPLTLTFSATIPSGVNYVVHYTIRRYLGDLPEAAFASSAAHVTANTVGYRYDDDVVTVTDGGTASGLTLNERGDIHAADLEPYITGATVRGLWVLRAGAYTVGGTGNWTFATRIQNDRLGTVPSIKVAAARGTDVLLSSSIAFRDVSIGTASTTNKRFIASSHFSYEASSDATIEAGSLELTGSGADIKQTLRRYRAQTNGTMTGAVTGSLIVTGTATVVIEDFDIQAHPTAATGLLAYLYVYNKNGPAYIRNGVISGAASGIDGLRLDAVTGNVTIENCFIASLGTGDSWAVNIIDSYGIHFKNCYFYSERGQAVRVENSGVTFENCVMESGTDTGLSSPQLICGEGYATVSTQQENVFRIVNCRAVYGAANVRATGVPTKAIVELGGRDSTVNIGRVDVDGLFIRPSSGSLAQHNYSTVLLHDHEDNHTPNRYAGITLDMLGTDPTESGTLGEFTGIFTGGGCLVEMAGAFATPRSRMKVKDLSVVGVGWPSTANITRGIVRATRTDIDGLIVDGSASAAGNYDVPLVECLVACDLYDVRFFPSEGLLSVSTSATALYLNSTCRVRGLLYHHRSVDTTPSGPIVAVGRDCELVEALCYVDTAITLNGTGLVKMFDHRGLVESSKFIVNGVVTDGGSGPDLIVNTNNKHELRVLGNYFRWENTTADSIINMSTADLSVISGNQFLTTSTGAGDEPVYGFSGTNTLPAATLEDLNIFGKSADTTDPHIYRAEGD